MERRVTPEYIESLDTNQVFVFGSNLAGLHGGGAARTAYKHFGAIWGQGVGIQGQSYGIPTMQGGTETIEPYVKDFIEFARSRAELTFLVTRIGCGIAGFTDREIAPLFYSARNVPNIYLPESFWDVLELHDPYELSRFIEAQDNNSSYETALSEINAGYKISHWIWYVFPQVSGLGRSSHSERYAIRSREEAEAYLADETLGNRLREISRCLLSHRGKDITEIMGGIDSTKLKSSMTLFSAISEEQVFNEVLELFFSGEKCQRTLAFLQESEKIENAESKPKCRWTRFFCRK